MAIPYLVNIDLNQNQLLQAAIQNLASDPGSPVAGQMWFQTTVDLMRYYDGSSVITLYDSDTANTANKLVRRDGSGDFAAHDITANKVTGLAAPSGSSDAANKGYVDAAIAGLDWHASVRAATTGNIDLADAPAAADDVDLDNGDRVLVKDQTDPAENGVYDFNGEGQVMTRSSDANASVEVTGGFAVWVNEGTTNGDSAWILTTDDPITLGTTELTFSQFSSSSITAGAGLTQTGNTFDVVGTADRITVNADSIDIAATYAGQTSIVTLGTITTGTWSATTIAINKGGTGQTTAGAAFNALSPMTTLGDVIYGGSSGAGTRLAGNTTTTKKFLNQTGNGSVSAAPSWDPIALADLPAGTSKTYATDIGDNSATSITVTHNLGTRDVIVQVRDNNSPYAYVGVDVEAATTNTVTIKFAVAPDTNRYRCIVHA